MGKKVHFHHIDHPLCDEGGSEGLSLFLQAKCCETEVPTQATLQECVLFTRLTCCGSNGSSCVSRDPTRTWGAKEVPGKGSCSPKKYANLRGKAT